MVKLKPFLVSFCENTWRLYLAAAVMVIGLVAAFSVKAQTLNENSFRIDHLVTVKSGESCIQAFARIGETVGVAECIDMANYAGLSVLWSRPDLNKEAVISVDLHPGDRVGVAEKGSQKARFILPRDPFLALADPLSQKK